jgi:hypothetical protein
MSVIEEFPEANLDDIIIKYDNAMLFENLPPKLGNFIISVYLGDTYSIDHCVLIGGDAETQNILVNEPAILYHAICEILRESGDVMDMIEDKLNKIINKIFRDIHSLFMAHNAPWEGMIERSENVHDSSVNLSLKKIYNYIKKETNKHTIDDIRNDIDKYIYFDISGDHKDRTYKVLNIIESVNTYIMNLEANEVKILLDVYDYVKDNNIDILDTLLYEFANLININKPDGIECANGRVGIMLSIIEPFDERFTIDCIPSLRIHVLQNKAPIYVREYTGSLDDFLKLSDFIYNRIKEEFSEKLPERYILEFTNEIVDGLR